jgi:peptidoglycan/LPS O-acetylase OafA/YrhL
MPVLRGIFASRGMNPNLIYLLSWFRFDGLAAGAMIAIWVRSPFASQRAARQLALGLIIGLAVLSAVGARYGLFGTATPVSVALRYTQVYLLFASLFVLVVAYRETRWTSPLRWRFLQLSGALSYCLYLVHLSTGDAYEYVIKTYGISPVDYLGPAGAMLARGVAIVVMSFGIALLSRRYLEEPFLSLKDRFSSRRQPAVASSAALDPSTV